MQRISVDIFLNYDNWDEFYKEISGRSDPCAKAFQEAKLWLQVEKLQKEWKDQQEFLKKNNLWEKVGHLFKVSNQKGEKRGERQQLEKEGDHFAITKTICEILEISPLTKTTELSSKQLHQEYFSLMKEKGFLVTNYKELDQVKYDPGEEVKRYFQENPKTNRVALGCGKAVNSQGSLCNETEELMHWHESVMTVDIEPGSCDIIADLHDQRLWKALVECGLQSLDEVADHTNGRFLFESESAETTLKGIHQALKVGGKLSFVFPPDEPDQNFLKKHGFEQVDNKNWEKI